LLTEPHLTATECHLPRCYLPSDTSEHARHNPNQSESDRLVLDLSTPEGRKAVELTYRWLVTYRDGLPAQRRLSIQVL